MQKIVFTADDETSAMIEAKIDGVMRSRSAVITAAIHAFCRGPAPVAPSAPQPRARTAKPKPKEVPDFDAMTDEEVMAFLLQNDVFEPKEGEKDEYGMYHRHEIGRHTTIGEGLAGHGQEFRVLVEHVSKYPDFPENARSESTQPLSDVAREVRALFKARFDAEQKALAEKESGA